MKPKAFLAEAVRVIDAYERALKNDRDGVKQALNAMALLMTLLPVSIRHVDAETRLQKAFNGKLS